MLQLQGLSIAFGGLKAVQDVSLAVPAGSLTALRITKQRMKDQRVVFVGAGAACTGIAQLCEIAMRADGAGWMSAITAAAITIPSKGATIHRCRRLSGRIIALPPPSGEDCVQPAGRRPSPTAARRAATARPPQA